ncbi:MAG: DUF2283 domain-containing protein [Chloroherpetonaceae bacterium]
MEELKIIPNISHANWDYDGEADTLYISIGEPQAAIGLDAGNGIILRYKEDTKELIGLTILGVKARASQQFHD